MNNFWSFNRFRDADLIQHEDIIWQGVFSWVGFEEKNHLPTLPDIEGVYLHTFEYKDGYILRSAGVTKSMKRRCKEHTREFMKGNYTVLDVECAKNGERKEIWHGWYYARTHQEEFKGNKDFIMDYIQKELIAYRLFVAEVNDKRKRERIEAAIILQAYCSKEPWADLADRGMALKERDNGELPVLINNICSKKIYGLSSILEI